MLNFKNRNDTREHVFTTLSINDFRDFLQFMASIIFFNIALKINQKVQFGQVSGGCGCFTENSQKSDQVICNSLRIFISIDFYDDLFSNLM